MTESKEAFKALSEIAVILFLVLVFNLIIKQILTKFADRFERKEQPWHEGFLKALILPVTYFSWYVAGLLILDLVSEHFFSIRLFKDLPAWLKIGGVFAFGWFLMRWKKSAMKLMLKKSKNHEIAMDAGKLDVINKIMTIAILFLIFLMLLESTHSSINTLIAFGGIGGLALAFASQEIIANFFSGAMIYLTQPFLVGDRIHIPEKNIEGDVEEIGWYTTRIRTGDKRPVYIPNSIFSKIIVITPSRMTHRQITETFNLRYDDMPKMEVLIHDIKAMLKNNPDIDQKQKTMVYLSTFATYSLDVFISTYTKTTNVDKFFEVRQRVLFEIYEILKKHDVKTAVPITYVEMAKGK